VVKTTGGTTEPLPGFPVPLNSLILQLGRSVQRIFGTWFQGRHISINLTAESRPFPDHAGEAGNGRGGACNTVAQDIQFFDKHERGGI